MKINKIQGMTEIDHPSCQECSQQIFTKLEKKLNEVRKERDSIATFLTQLNEQDAMMKRSKTNLQESDLEAVMNMGFKIGLLVCS